MLVKNLLKIQHWNNCLNGTSVKGHKTCVCIRALPALLNPLYFHPLLNLHSYTCNFLKAEQASAHIYCPTTLYASYGLKEHKMGTELKKIIQKKILGQVKAAWWCLRKNDNRESYSKIFLNHYQLARSFNTSRIFPGVHEVHIFLFSSKNEIIISIFYVNVNILIVSIATELILSLRDTTSSTSNLMYYFKLQKKSNHNNSKLPCNSSTTDLFIIM